MQTLTFDQITIDAGTQVRAEINQQTVDEYAEKMAAGEVFPPVIIFSDGNKYVLADGFHRFFAAMKSGASEMVCEVKKGTVEHALIYALGANVKHGFRLTQKDKRHAIELALKQWPKSSDRQIANTCYVSPSTVADVRQEIQLANSTSSTVQLSNLDSSKPEQTRIGADGKERKLPAKKEKKPEPPPMVSPVPEVPHIMTSEQVLADDEGKPDDELIQCQSDLEVFEDSFNQLTKQSNREIIIAAVKLFIERS